MLLDSIIYLKQRILSLQVIESLSRRGKENNLFYLLKIKFL